MTIIAALGCFCFISADTKVSGLQSGVWQNKDNVYVLEGEVTIPKGLLLTIESGVIVKSNGDYGIIVDGDLAVSGSVEGPVCFTSFADDRTGGDTNKDGIESGPTPLDWRGIKINNAQSKSVFKNIRIRHSREPFVSVSTHLSIDSLYLDGNATQKIILGPDTVKIAEKSFYSNKNKIASAPSALPKTKMQVAVHWYQKPLIIVPVVLGAVGAVSVYAIIANGDNADKTTNNENITNAPGPPF
jgi:hypothetical protein